ncbi:DUF4124 domain-containing protein [Inhella gelatinilytica]|uniref:DUF4124 domain-containing protein n=1 Tax=Inhella gelatinilytica TaxID=2795030 RepID=A0A931ITC5_9BURK|nr:DUF4124 domain-containing protein [Inhella gelatinilytica]MBH9551754.1 DUF4124 domain-containing protein [Inhella gelatinilytica]
MIRRLAWMWKASLALTAISTAAWGQSASPTPAGPKIYSCVTADGRRLTSDRPIPECQGREQTLHRSDGTVRAKVAPAKSPEEKAADEVLQRELLAKKAALDDAIRHDRNLMARFKNRAAHDLARAAALDDLDAATGVTQRRLASLAKERKGLDDEAEFYKKKTLPPKLKQALDANDAATEAQKLFLEQQSAERGRVNRRYDLELTRLQKLWAGAPPGSLGPPPSAHESEPPPSAASVSGARR